MVATFTSSHRSICDVGIAEWKLYAYPLRETLDGISKNHRCAVFLILREAIGRRIDDGSFRAPRVSESNRNN